MGKLEGKVARLASEGDDHAVQIANNSAYGLSGSLRGGRRRRVRGGGSRQPSGM